MQRAGVDSCAAGRLRVEPLSQEWRNLHGVLHGHHEAEDTGLFVAVRGQHPELAAVLDQLTADHRRIDPLLDRGDRAFAGLPATAGEAAAVIAELAALLHPHLQIEEEQVVPCFREVRAFPPIASEGELQMFAEGFAWACHLP